VSYVLPSTLVTKLPLPKIKIQYANFRLTYCRLEMKMKGLKCLLQVTSCNFPVIGFFLTGKQYEKALKVKVKVKVEIKCHREVYTLAVWNCGDGDSRRVH